MQAPYIPAAPEWAKLATAELGRIIDGVRHDDYHGARGLISKSGLDEFARSPLHFRYWVDQHDDDPTPALITGQAFHVLTLEPDRFKAAYIELPDFGDMRSSRNREVRDRWKMDEAQGLIALDARDWWTVHKMRDAVMAHSAVRKLMAKGKPEVTATWRDPHTGLQCKSRCDWLADHVDAKLDLKSAANGAPWIWRLDAAKYRYHVQDALYSAGFEHAGGPPGNFVFIVCEKEPPFAVGVYQLDDTARLAGETLYMRELEALNECVQNNYWPAYGDTVKDLALPTWATAEFVDHA